MWWRLPNSGNTLKAIEFKWVNCLECNWYLNKVDINSSLISHISKYILTYVVGSKDWAVKVSKNPQAYRYRFWAAFDRANIKTTHLLCILSTFPWMSPLHCSPLPSTHFSYLPVWSWLFLSLLPVHGTKLNCGWMIYYIYVFLKVLDFLDKLENLLWFSIFLLVCFNKKQCCHFFFWTIIDRVCFWKPQRKPL